ncbi:hypothetical protein Goklo_029586 [Gossypium klotzschianum]|uniref:Uncharacterized protein n=1 Tax=Gossypium klotzschianum TaxID=34286 RepID=A0A7J8W570_9ROSI|nr:hypothetical protein [Gossypium klotzschianum]
MIPTAQPFQMMPGWSQWPGSALFLVTLSGSPMYRTTTWLIVPTLTTRCPTGRTRIPVGGTTTASESWIKEESNA